MTCLGKSIRTRWASVLAAAGLALLPSAAAAQTADPSPGTPQANQYEIPVQAGRHDAAPPKDRPNSGGGSLYRSNNNFGSSSVIPGDPGGGGGGTGGTGGAAGSSAPAAAGVAAAGVGAAANRNALDTGSPSTGAALTTLPLIIALGVVIGIVGAKMRRRAEL
jgi:hypothetical protein